VYLQIINIAFLPHILLLFLPIAILPEYNRAKCGLRNDIKIKRSEELEKERHPSTKKKRKEKRKEKKEESMTREEFTMSACVCVCKESNQTPHLPDPSLQLNVAFGEAQRCALFCPTHAGR
jgi:hypothetical protein